MSVFKNIQIGLLCTTISFCYGMELSQKKEEGKQVQIGSIASTPAETLYQEAVEELKMIYSPDQETSPSKDLISSMLKKLQVSAFDKFYEPAFTLFKIVTTSFAEPTKLSYPFEMIAAQIKLQYFMGLQHVGFSLIRSTLLSKNNAIDTFLNDVLYNKQIVTCFFKQLRDDEELIKLQHAILNGYFLSEFNIQKSSELDEDMQAHIGMLYITGANSLLTFVHNVDISKQQILKISADAYLDVGLKYCILAAKQGNNRAYELLLSKLKNNDWACVYYYKYLIPFLESNDDQAQDLFNRVASENKKAFLYFDDYASNVYNMDQNSPSLQFINRVMNGYDRYFKVKYNPDGQIGLYNHKEGTDYFALRTPLRKVEVEIQLTPADKHKKALGYYGSDPAQALSLFFEILDDKNSSPQLLKKVDGQLADIRKKKGYKNPGSFNKTDRAGDIGYLLFQRETSQVLSSSEGKQKTKSSQELKKTVTTSNATTPNRKKGHSTTSPSSITKENILPKKASPQVLEATTTATTSTTTKKRRGKKPAKEIISLTVLQDTLQPQGNMPLIAAIVPTIEVMREMAPVIEEKQPPIAQANIEKTSDDLVPNQSLEEAAPSLERKVSSGEKEKVSRTLKPSKELSKERRTLHRTRSLNLGTNDSEQKEAKERKTLQRTYSLMNMSSQADVIEQPTVKRYKNDKKSAVPISKKYLTMEKDKKRKTAKQTPQIDEEKEFLVSRSTQSDSESGSESESEGVPYKRLRSKILNKNLQCITDVSLRESVIKSTLRHLKTRGKINYTWEHNTISATHKTNQNIHLTVHTHDKSGLAWYVRPEIKKDILEFFSKCDDDLKELIGSIGSKK